MIEAPAIPVSDPFGVANDPALTFLARALDPGEVQHQFECCLPSWLAENKSFQLRAIRVVRHKPGRRCLIEYDIEKVQHNGAVEALTLIGKTRSKGLDDSTYQLLVSLRNAGFGVNSADGILVPEPIGCIPEFRMWLQRKARGVNATRLMAAPEGIHLASRIAEAAHKLHKMKIHPKRRHTMADELRILHERLPLVAALRTEWAVRIERLIEACDRLGAPTPEPRPVGIHRDFYADQILVDGERLYLLDFDLYCEGDPAVDIGNFVGHITEYAIRTNGDPGSLYEREDALVERFVELTGEMVRPAIQVYTILTLVRHIYLSTQFDDRQHTTEALLELCEDRLRS